MITCTHDPRETFGPIGMYHCPECGDMVLAGCNHPDYSIEQMPDECAMLPEDVTRAKGVDFNGYVNVYDPTLDGNPTCHVCGAIFTRRGNVWLCLSCGTHTGVELPSIEGRDLGDEQPE